ncbi:MAG: 50S ribosomal protein L4 [Candidatus Omnitrophota bacterium]|nr:MAG: 50S ribosomal protein L4 [Candidatus Omnitrophota bacterium]
MAKISVSDTKGKEVEQLALDARIFDGKINEPLMHQAVVAYLANQRKGVASTKTKAKVRGGGRKPWRQKGTGRARVGSIRSPLWRGGGVTFGPHPRSYRKEFPKRMKVLALKSALNLKLRDKELVVLDELKADSHKTKKFLAIMKKLKLADMKVRFIVEKCGKNLLLASRNIQKVAVEPGHTLTTYEALDCQKIVFTKDALIKTQERIKKWVS